MSKGTVDVLANNDVRKTYEYIVRYIKNNGYAPTQHEIVDNTFASTHTVQTHLKALELAGYITRAKRKSRALKLNNYVLMEKV